MLLQNVELFLQASICEILKETVLRLRLHLTPSQKMTDTRKKKPKSMKLNTGESSRSQGMVRKDFGENQACRLFPPNSKKTAGSFIHET